MKKFSLPPFYEDWIEKHLHETGFTLNKPEKLAKAILDVSTNYQKKDSITDWKSPATQAAYMAYFFPLNSIRFAKVLDEIKRINFLDGIDQAIDFGCGPGPSTKLIAADTDISLKSIVGIDNHPEVRSPFLDTPRSQLELNFRMDRPRNSLDQSVIMASYVLNEMTQLPLWFYQAEALIILEPSTKQAFEYFNEMRQEILDKGYDLWAPCSHTEQCPLSQSKKDWCFDRAHWEAPAWFKRIENHLPIKNETLSFSYLLARKRKKETSSDIRIVGDALVEKGKTRWMICQSQEREFASFLKRYGKPPQIYRGDLMQLGEYEKKGNEVRLTSENFQIRS